MKKPEIVTYTDLLGAQRAELHGCPKYQQAALFGDDHKLTPEEQKLSDAFIREAAEAIHNLTFDFE